MSSTPRRIGAERAVTRLLFNLRVQYVRVSMPWRRHGITLTTNCWSESEVPFALRCRGSHPKGDSSACSCRDSSFGGVRAVDPIAAKNEPYPEARLHGHYVTVVNEGRDSRVLSARSRSRRHGAENVHCYKDAER